LKFETRNFYTGYLIGLSFELASFMALCEKLGLRLGKNPDIGSIVGKEKKSEISA
jgi:hypothetical protein